MKSGSVVFRSTTLVCVGLMVFVSTSAVGCNPPAGGNSNGNDNGDGGTNQPISLSAFDAKIGEFVAIEHPSIQAGQTYTVSFRQLDGTVQPHEVVAHADGELSLPVPPVATPGTDVLSGGAFFVSLEGAPGEERLQSTGYYLLPDGAVGTILPLFLQSAIDDYDALADRLTTAADELTDAPQRDELLEAVAQHRAYLSGLLDELESTGTITVAVSESETLTLDSGQLYAVEQYLVHGIIGAHEELARRQSGASSRTIGGNCLSELRSGAITSAQLEQCMEECIEDVKESAIRGSQTAGVLPTLAGIAITLVGVVTSEAVVVTGLLVAAGGAIHGFVTAYASNQNSDSFGSRDAGGFNSSQEMLSQGSRVGISVLSNAPGPVGVAFGGASVAVAANDYGNAIKSARCDDDSPRRVIQQVSADIEFCIALDQGGGDGPSGEDDSDNGACDPSGVGQFCCGGDELCDEDLSSCDQDTDCDFCGVDGICIAFCEPLDSDCIGDGGNSNGNDNSDNGNDNSDDQPVVIGQPTMGVCPSGFVIDVGVFDPALIDLVLDDFERFGEDEFTRASCLYVRADGGTGSWALAIYYGESSGACDDDSGGSSVSNGGLLQSTQRTVEVTEVFSTGSRLIDRLDVLGGFLDSAVSAGVGAPCP